ncbi:transcription termination factor Rho [Bradyrhizobium sp. USDA 4341]
MADDVQRGKVLKLHIHEDEESYYVIVKPEGATSDKEYIYVSHKVVRGEHLRRGDKVEFVPNKFRDATYPLHSAAAAWRAPKEGNSDVA